MIIKDWKKEIFTIPNLLSLFRLLLIPVYVTIYLNAKSNMDYFLAAGILAVSCLTDMIDGKIARHFNMISTVGKVLDPLADKLTQFTLILCLAVRHNILWYLVGLFFVKESFQLIIGGINLKKGRMLKTSLISGKISTTVLFVSLVLLVLLPTLSENVINWVAIADGIFLLVAFLDYGIAYCCRPSCFVYFDKENQEKNGQ